MPNRHFYLLRHHILFYIKFLLFCSFAPDEIRSLCEKNEDFPQKPMFFLFSHIFISSVISNNLYLSPLEINFPESYILLVHSTLPNCRFKIARKKKKHHIPDAASERVFKMRTNILNTATTEQMGYGIFSFFVYTKSTN